MAFKRIFSGARRLFQPYHAVSICAVLGEEPYLLEWIAYHRVVGIGHFFLYGPEEHAQAELLRKLASRGLLTYSTSAKETPSSIYNDALAHFGSRTAWMALLNTNEFLVPNQSYAIPEVLERYDFANGIGINGKLFDTYTHAPSTDSLFIERHTTCAHPDFPHHQYVHPVVRPSFVQEMQGTKVILKEGVMVNADGEVLRPEQSAFTPRVTHEHLQCNRYLHAQAEEDAIRTIHKSTLEDPEQWHPFDTAFRFTDIMIQRFARETHAEMKRLHRVLSGS